MIITHHKGEFIKVVFGSTTLAYNPISKKSKIELTKFGADVALVSLNHPDMNGIDEVSRSSKELFVIDGPGEYEVNSIFVHGFASESEYDDKNLINTMYSVKMEDMNLVFIGALADVKKMDFSITEDMTSVDVLFIPIGSDGVLTPADAHKLSVSLEAKVVIPIHFDGIGSKGMLKEFLKESGDDGVKSVDKLTIKKKDLEEYNGTVVVIQS